MASDPLKALTILSDTTVRGAAGEKVDLKHYWRSEKRPNFPKTSFSLLLTNFSEILLTTERRLTGR